MGIGHGTINFATSIFFKIGGWPKISNDTRISFSSYYRPLICLTSLYDINRASKETDKVPVCTVYRVTGDQQGTASPSA